MEKRTNWDFSKHTHKVELFKSEDGNEIRVDHFRKGNDNCGYIKFVNDVRGLSVFGDFGNWIFCRPFHPSKDARVCEMYWNEKLKISSSQDHAKYDGEETAREIKKFIKEDLKEHGYSDEDYDKCREWFEHLHTLTDDELEYTYEAYRGENPTDIDYDYIPFVKEGSYQLKIVFDAFDEICKRLKDAD